MSPLALLSPPTGPSPVVPWGELQVFDWVRALEACPQDAVHHAEGNVWIHTRMVLETLCSLPAFVALPEADRQIVYLACLLHDVAKPATTRTQEDGRITAKGHSRRGEVMARKILWELGLPFAVREQVCALIRFHQIPFFLIDSPDAQRVAAEISLSTRCDLLAIVAEADIRGRICQSVGQVLDSIELFREFCSGEGCLSSPRPFASDHTRFMFFNTEGRHPDVEAFDDTRTEAVVMSGLPGAGKDTLVSTTFKGWPVVSLDALREEMGLDHGGNQGVLIQEARERARAHLRKGERFVWNATNLQRQFRAPLLSLLADYHARIRIVYVEAPAETLYAQNRDRKAVVPEPVIRKMLERWELPEPIEAHQVEYAVRG